MGAAIIIDGREGAVGNTGWLTPPDVFDRYAAEFGPFDLDPAGNPESYATQHCEAFCTETGTYNWTGLEMPRTSHVSDEDGLAYEWEGRVWCNPPYRNVEAWVAKGSASAKAGALVVMLLLPSTDSGWFHRYVWDKDAHRPREGVEARFLQGRIRFIHPDPAKRETDFKGFRPVSGNLVVIFHPPIPTYASRIEHWLANGDPESLAHAIAFWELGKGETQAMTDKDRDELERVTGYREHPSERLEVSR